MQFFVAKMGLAPNSQHEHLIYMNEQGQMVCGKAKGHTHPLGLIEPQAQGELPGVEVLEAEAHIHPVAPLSPATPELPEPDPLTDSELIHTKITQFENALTADRESIDRGQESVMFKEGKQWTDEAIAKLAADSRACLTINHVAPMVESLSGLYRRNRTDLRCYPTENSDADIANVLTYALKNILSQTSSDTEETEAFEDMVTTGRGILELYPDFDADIRGQIKLRYNPWDMTVFGPHLRKDLEDCEYLCSWAWLSRDRMINLYPEYKEQINDMFGKFERHILGMTDLSDMDTPLIDSMFADTKTKEVRMVECEEKVYYRLKYFIDVQTGWMTDELSVPKPYRNQLKSMSTLLRTTDRRMHRIRRTIFAGDLVLEDGFVNRPTPPNSTGPSFSKFPIYAYKRGNRFEGKVERLKDPQREINKRRSQIVDIVNTSINNGWITAKGTFGTQQEKHKFQNSVSKAGFIVEVPDLSQPPIKVESGQVSPAVVQLEMNSLQSFRETSNVNLEMLGMGSQYQSGTAISHRIQQALMGNEYLFDNMSQVKKRIGREILLWIQALYTPDRLARIFFDQAKIEKIYIGGQEVDPQDMQTFQQIVARLQDADLTKYDVTIGETGQSPTAQLANFEMMMELAQKGVPLPPQLFIELAPIPNKERIMQILSESHQQQADAEQKKYDTEIQKTMIAAQSKNQPRQS